MFFYKKDSKERKSEKLSTTIKDILGKSCDVVFRDLYLNSQNPIKVILVYIDGTINKAKLSDFVLKPLNEIREFREAKTQGRIIEQIENGLIYNVNQNKSKDIDKIVGKIINGNAVLMFDEEDVAICFDVRNFEKRSITTPTEEISTKGSKDAFVETLTVNTAMVRGRIKTSNLVIEDTIVGEQTKTAIAMVYINDIANEKIVKETRKRINEIKIDQALFMTVVEEAIVDNKSTPFPQVTYTEKPDKFCIGLTEGKVGVIIDGIPFAYVLPSVLVDFFQSTDDYSYNYIITSGIRALRYFLTAFTLVLPGFYIAITLFHQEMIPTPLAFSIAASRAGVPFPIFIEVLVLTIAFHTLVEAGLKVSKSIGNTVSVVGGLVLGEAAISANVISPGVVLIVAFTAIASLSIPNKDLSAAILMWQVIIIFLSSVLGLFGLTMGILALILHLSKIEVLGVPYLAPYASNDGEELEDSIIRLPFSKIKKRIKYLNTKRK